MSPASYQASSITYSKQLSSNYNINNPTPRVKTTTGHWIGQTQFCQWPINHRPLGSLLRPTKPVISQLTQYPERLNSVPPPPPHTSIIICLSFPTGSNSLQHSCGGCSSSPSLSSRTLGSFSTRTPPLSILSSRMSSSPHATSASRAKWSTGTSGWWQPPLWHSSWRGQ